MEYSNYEKVNIAANKISSKTERLSFLLEQLSLWERNKPTWKQDPICNFENVYDRTIRLIKCDINTLELTLKYTTTQQSISSQQLKTKLTDTQLNTLADELINKDFIASTDKDCFVWALGGSEKVDKFKPIEWGVSKSALRELLTPILRTITNQHIREIKMLFTKKNKPLELNKQKRYEYSRHITDIESIIKKLNLPTTPTA